MFCQTRIQQGGLVSFRFRGIMNCGGLKQDWQFHEAKRNELWNAPAISHSPSIQDSKRSHNVGNVFLVSDSCRRRAAKGEERVHVNEIKLRDVSAQPSR